MKVFTYDSLTNGQTIHLDKAQRAFIYAKYNEHASESYVVFDKGRLRPQTVVHTYIHEYYDDNGVFLRKESETIKEKLETKPLVLVGGIGRLKKVTLLWEDIDAFKYDGSKASDYKATKPRVRKQKDEITICTKGLSPEQLELLRTLGVQV